MWNGRRWRLLLNLIDHLPRNSYLVEAQAADEELARAYLARQSGAEQAEPEERMSEWSPERDALARIEDLLANLIAVTVGVATGKSTNPKPARRPVTATQRLRKQQRHDKHHQLASRILPRAEGAPAAP